MKPNLGLKQLFFNATGTIVANFTFLIAPAIVIHSEVTELKNALKKLLLFYFVFYLTDGASSRVNFNSLPSQNSLENTSISSTGPDQGRIFGIFSFFENFNF